MKIVKRILLAILILIVVIVVIVGIVIAVNAPANVKAMNESVDTFCNTVEEYYPVTEEDCGEYNSVTLYGVMKFNIKQYTVEGLGNLAVMTTNMGLMQMATVVLTPVQEDIPLISMDYIYMLGNRTAYVEFYDLVLEQDEEYASLLNELESILEQYDDLETVTPTAAWYDTLKTVGFYKKGTKADDAELIEMMREGVDMVMVYSEAQPELDSDAQIQKAALQKEYSDGLIENGGVSTDNFVKCLGEEKTRDFFDSVLFKAE